MKKISKKEQILQIQKAIKEIYSILSFEDDDKLNRMPTDPELHLWGTEINRAILLAKSKKHRAVALDLADAYIDMVCRIAKLANR